MLESYAVNVPRYSETDRESGTQRKAQTQKDRLKRVLQSQWTISVFVLILALTVRMAHICEAKKSPLMPGVPPMWDSQFYFRQAVKIAEGHIMGHEVFYVAPLYPYLMAIPHRLFRTEKPDGTYVYSNINIVRYLQCALGAISCLLVFWVGTLLMGRGVGLLAGLLSVTYGVFVYYDGILMPSSLILSLHLLALLILLVAARRNSTAWWGIAGVVLGLCAAAHGSALLLLVGVLVGVWIGLPTPNVRTKLNRTVLLLAGFVPIVGLITVRNYVVGKDFVLMTANVGKNLYIGNNPTASGSFKPYKLDFWGSKMSYYISDTKRTPFDMRPSEGSKKLTRMAFEFAVEHPVQELLILAKKFRLFFNAVEVGVSDNYYFAKRYSNVLRFGILSFGVVGPIGLTGLFYGLRQWRKHLLLLIFIASQIISFTIVFVLARYRLVFVACLMIFAAAQMMWWWTRLREKQYRRIALSLVPLVLFALWVHYPVDGFTKSRGFGQQYYWIGTSYLSWGQLEKAKEAFEKALEANFEPLDDVLLRRAKCYTALGNIHERLHNLPAAIEAYEKALSIIRFEPRTNPNLLQRKKLEDRLKILRQ